MKVTKLQKIISKIEKRHNKKIDLSLDRTFNLLNKLGNPQNKLNNVVTVVGTNAKASMATALSTILKESSYKYNLYTSPHLQSYTERFVFNNNEVSENDLAILLEDVDRIFVNQGPGKFSSLRISISIAKAISFAKNISLYGFDSKFIKNGNYKKLLEIDKKNLLNNDLIKPLYSS